MLDKFNRKIDYIRISVTDLCNLRCTYCMPANGIEKKKHHDILSFEQIEKIAKVCVQLGIKKIRLTGGEPLVRKNIEFLVSKLSKLEGLSALAMTTNGVLLKEKAAALKKAGLNALNISLDSIDPEKYAKLTRIGKLDKVLNGIDESLLHGFSSIKINMVVFEETSDFEITQMKEFCMLKGLKLQLINHFSLGHIKSPQDNYIYDRPLPCEKCNRIRLLADGKLKPCLFSDNEIQVDFSDIKGSILQTIQEKPDVGASCNKRNMNEIGG
ncbi:MAG: radical SAM protein [Pseudomonadota bacterium]